MSHLIEQDQWVAASLAEAFGLLSDAFALEATTPPWLVIRVTTPPPIEMGRETLIDYRLRLHGVPLRWRTRIDAWDPPRGFAEVQVRGPYRHWHHTHSLEPADGGTRVRDRVHYSLPFGRLGDLAQPLFVRRDLERIFEYRRRAVAMLLATAARPRGPLADEGGGR